MIRQVRIIEARRPFVSLALRMSVALTTVFGRTGGAASGGLGTTAITTTMPFGAGNG